MNYIDNPYLPIIQKRVLALLQQGIIPWRQGFSPDGVARIYNGSYIQGLSWLLCNFTTPHSIPLYFRWDQIQQLEGRVIKNSKAEYIYYPRNGVVKRFPIYNISSINGLPKSKIPTLPTKLFNPAVIDRWVTPLLTITPTKSTLQKLPRWDTLKEVVRLPVHPDKSPTYYWHLFKALVSWTGCAAALNRDSPFQLMLQYPSGLQLEALICELGATFLCGYFGIYAPCIAKEEHIIDWWYHVYRSPDILMKGVWGMREGVDYLFSVTYKNMG